GVEEQGPDPFAGSGSAGLPGQYRPRGCGQAGGLGGLAGALPAFEDDQPAPTAWRGRRGGMGQSAARFLAAAALRAGAFLVAFFVAPLAFLAAAVALAGAGAFFAAADLF